MKQNNIQKITYIDEEIIELMKKRSLLLNKIKVKGYVPSEIEKKLRQHWEQYASEKTKDSTFIRTLFKMLQQVEMQEGGELTPGRFILSPSKSPLTCSLNGTISEELAHLTLLYSVITHQPITLQNVAISDYIFSTIKMLQTIGVGITWEHTTISIHSFDINLNDVVIHFAESEISLYLFFALSVAYFGHSKCVGGLPLSMLSLTTCKEVLAQCGVRITSLGGVSGIPARVESTRQIPEHLDIPSSLHKDMVIALCVVFSGLEKAITLNIEHHPERDEIIETLTVFHDIIGSAYTISTYTISYAEDIAPLPSELVLPLDPYHLFVRGSLPYFTGGSITIKGSYCSSPLYTVILEQLAQCGLQIQQESDAIIITKEGDFNITEYNILPPKYFPILLTMFLYSIRHTKKAQLPPLPSGIELSEVQSFLEALSIVEENGNIEFGKEHSHYAWIAPSAYWVIGYAYAGFLFSGIVLANPSDVTSVLPNFWKLYNSLPSPIEYEEPKLQETAPVKRRLIVR